MTSTTNKIMWAVGTVIVAILLAEMFGGSAGKVLGSAGAGITNLTGLSIDGTSPGTLTVNGATTLSSLTVTSTNTATSTTSVGCVQTTATSTATPIRLTFSLPSQNAATTTTQGGASIGNVVWQYGTCPI